MDQDQFVEKLHQVDLKVTRIEVSQKWIVDRLKEQGVVWYRNRSFYVSISAVAIAALSLLVSKGII